MLLTRFLIYCSLRKICRAALWVVGSPTSLVVEMCSSTVVCLQNNKAIHYSYTLTHCQFLKPDLTLMICILLLSSSQPLLYLPMDSKYVRDIHLWEIANFIGLVVSVYFINLSLFHDSNSPCWETLMWSESIYVSATLLHKCHAYYNFVLSLPTFITLDWNLETRGTSAT